jgi:signal transduction histidine kinase/ligand-binding sensor domain-containing protein
MFLWLLVGLPIPSQGGGLDFFSPIIQVWQTENGLPNNILTDVQQGADHYLWIGTLNGLARFDGIQFQVFNSENTPALQDPWIDHLFKTADGTLWIGTHHGGLSSFHEGRFALELPPRLDEDWVVKYVGSRSNAAFFLTQAGRVVCGEPGTMRLLNEPAPVESLLGFNMPPARNAVIDGQGVVWFARADRLEGRLIGNRFETFKVVPGLANLRCNALCVDVRGRVWVGTDQELSVWENNHFVRVAPAAGEPSLAVKNLYPCKDGSLWVSANGRLRKLRGKEWVGEADAAGPPFETPVMQMCEDQRGNLWFGSYGEGLWCLAPDGRTQRVGVAEGLPNNRVSSLCVDAEDNLWASLDLGGLVRIRERRFAVAKIFTDKNEPAAVSVCQSRSGALWVGTYGDGLVCLESNRTTIYASGFSGSNELSFDPAGSKGYVLSVLEDRKGRIWAGTQGAGVFWLTNNQFVTPFPIDKVGSQARVIYQDHLGRIWFGNSLGLYVWSQEHLKKCGLPEGVGRLEVRAILDDGAGGVWVGTRGQGLRHYRDGQWQTWRREDGPGSDTVWALFTDERQTLWLGTEAGLVRFKDNHFVRLTTREGLPSDAIYNLMQDEQGWLWAASHQGVFRVRLSELNALAQGKIPAVHCFIYDLSDGLPTLQCSGGSQPAGWRGKDGKLWFTTMKGVVEVNPAALTINTQAPPVVIEEMSVDQVVQAIPFHGIEPRESIRIPPDRDRFQFRFTALSFTAPEKVRFRYRLEGLEKNWSAADAQRSAKYNKLPPGAYTFQVTACNDDGTWNETGTALPFVMLPWFWQTVWFKAMIGLLALGAFGALAWRIGRSRAQRKLAALGRERMLDRERARIARDIHDDLGASLTQVAFLGELTGRKADSPETVRQYCQRISGAAREMAQSLDAIIWAVKPDNDTLQNLIGYLDRRTHELLENFPGPYSFLAPKHIPGCIVSAEVRHNVFLAYKEALTNILKHARAKEVSVAIVIAGEWLQIDICDNGCGFDPSRGRPDGSGHKNMRQRLKEIGGTFEVDSQPEGGTRLKMRIPITSPADSRTVKPIHVMTFEDF